MGVSEQINYLVSHYCDDRDCAPSEVIFRKLVVLLHMNRLEERTYLYALAKQNYRQNTTVALKVLVLTHKVMLYCPHMEAKPLISLYKKVLETWTDIEQRKICEPSDRTRSAFFSLLI